MCLYCTQEHSVNYCQPFFKRLKVDIFLSWFCKQWGDMWLMTPPYMCHIHQKHHLGLNGQEENKICCQSLEVLERAYGNQMNFIEHPFQIIYSF